jgi:hypothetical protein
MPGDLFTRLNNQPDDGDLDEWHHWHNELIISGAELLKEVDTLLTSKTDAATTRRLEAHRAHILSVLSLAQRILPEQDCSRTRAMTLGRTMH